MAHQKLTARRVKTVRKPGHYGDGNGLYLQVSRWKTKTWIFRYARHGRTHDMGLGSLELVTLVEAREAALACRRLLLTGRDPIIARNAERTAARLEAAKAISFQVCAEQYIASHAAEWKSPKHRYHWAATLKNFAYPVIGTLPVALVDTDAVLRVLQPIWHSKTETASRLRGRIERVLDYAKVCGYREGENPARWNGHLAQALPRTSKVKVVKNHAALPYAEMPAFIRGLRAQQGEDLIVSNNATDLAARALEFLILTACRTGDILGQRGRDDRPAMQWGHVKDRLWTIPKTKNGSTHRVPLSDRASAILQSLPHQDGSVFVGLKEQHMRELLQRIRPDQGLTVHGFRSTFRDWAAEQTNFPREVCEAALAHTLKDKTEAAYQRGDHFEKRQRLMDAWAAYCAKPVAAADVIPLRTKN